MPNHQNHTERRKKFIEQLKANGKFDDYKKRRAELEKARRKRKQKTLDKLPYIQRKLLAEEKRARNRKAVQKHRIAKKAGTENLAGSETIATENLAGSETIATENLAGSETIATPKNIAEPETIAGSENNRNETISRQRVSKTTFDFPHSYKTTSTIRKDYTKINKSLPSSPSRRKVQVTKLYRAFGERDRRDIVGQKKSIAKKRESGLSPDLISCIQKFYERDDISRVSPNVKDVKSFRNCNGEKELRPLRHLLFTLTEAYTKFVEEYKRAKNCDPNVKRSKFCELRPENVLLIGETPRNVCFCIYHSNFSQCCVAIHKYVPQLPKDYTEMVQLLVCENATKDCHFKQCKECSETVINLKLKSISQYSTDGNKPVQWLQWLKDKEANRFQNERQNGTLQQLVDYLISIYCQFLKHRHIMHLQAEYFDIDQKRVDSTDHLNEATLNMDFPENFKCESQDEIQQANYNQKQISLFVCVLRHAAKIYSKAIASDNTHHTKETIVAYMYKIFSSLPSTVEIVKIWSDGPSSQFKNKFMAAVILLFEQKFNVKIFWNFYATAHGKACVDGLGASIKKKVRSMILTKERIVYETSDFVDAFNSKTSKVDLFGMTDEEINKINGQLNLNKVFAEAKTVRGISECHQLKIVNNKVKGFHTSKEGYQY